MSRHRGWFAGRRRRHRDLVFHLPTASALLRQVSPASAGGAENQVLLLARELARRNVSVGIVAVDVEGGLRREIDGVDIITQPASRTSLPGLRTIVFWLQMVLTLRAHPADVVVQRSANIHTAPLALLNRLTRRRFVFASAGVSDFDRGEWKRRHRWLFDLGVRLADEVVVQTAEQVLLCRDRFSRQPILIKSIGEPAQRPGDKPEAFLWIGRLSHHKRPLAYVDLARALPQARFRMVTVEKAPDEDGIEMAELARIADRVPNLELCPPRRRDELVPLYETAAAVVSTSVSEGMPNVFLEGWARGVPALTLAHDPDGVIEREHLGGYAAGSPVRLTELAKQIWESRRERAELAGRCRDYVAREHELAPIADRWMVALGLAGTEEAR